VLIGLSLVDLAPGGAQRLMVDLAEGLSRRGHTVRCAVLRGPRPRHYSRELHQRLAAVAETVSPEALCECEVIHMDGYHGPDDKAPYRAAWERTVETVHSAHSVEKSGPHWAAHVVAVSRAVADLVPGAVCVIYQGFDPEIFRPLETRKAYELAFVGRLHPVKNPDLFLDVCRRLAPVRACMVGGFSEAYRGAWRVRFLLRRWRLRLGGVRVAVTGFVNPRRVAQALNRSRVLLVTSHSEGFGRAAVEAQMCGVPVIVNDVPGLRETLEPGVTGHVAGRDDVGSFAQCARQLLEDEARARRMGVEAAEYARERFSLERMVREYVALYAEIASGRTPRGANCA